MDDNVIPLFQKPSGDPIRAELDDEAREFFRSLPLGFRVEHCAEARRILEWSVEALAFRSGVSVKAIRAFESGERRLREISLRALAFSLESEGLIFIPGHAPMRGDNVRGCTENPKLRHDYHLIE